MKTMLARNWWVLALRGVLAIIFGVLAFLWPGLTLITLVLLFGAYALVDGVFAVIAGIASYGRSQRWWGTLLVGIAGIVLGILTMLWPGTTALVLLYFIAAWAIVTGAFQVVAAIQLRREITNEWALIIGGILSILFGVLLVIFPGAGALSLTWMIGAYAVLFGILLIALALRLRSLPRGTETGGPARA
jgi:uncharacterized membrane protein HdeD (DUF308 family)